MKRCRPEARILRRIFRNGETRSCICGRSCCSARGFSKAATELHWGASLDWGRAALAADELVAPVAAGERWMQPAALLDAAVLAYLRTGQPEAARGALEALIPATNRAPGHLRHGVLAALVDSAAPSS